MHLFVFPRCVRDTYEEVVRARRARFICAFCEELQTLRRRRVRIKGERDKRRVGARAARGREGIRVGRGILYGKTVV